MPKMSTFVQILCITSNLFQILSFLSDYVYKALDIKNCPGGSAVTTDY